MVRVRCNCGTILSAPPSVRAARCPYCSFIVDLTPKTTQPQNQVPAVSQYYNCGPAQIINGNQRPSPQLSHVLSINGNQQTSPQLPHVPTINGNQRPSPQLSHIPTINGNQRPSRQLSRILSINANQQPSRQLSHILSINGNQQPSPKLSHVPTINGNQRTSPQLSHIPSIRKTKRAVLIGISYLGTPNSVKSSLNDVKMITNFLTRRSGFAQSSVLILTEEESDPNRIPTKRNIQAAMNWLIRGCEEGDSLVFFYSGHGSQAIDIDGDERDGFDEALCPVDHKTAGKILDDKINETIVRPLPYGVKLHAVIDTCRSGTLLDLQFTCKINRRGDFEWENQRTSKTDKGTSGGIAICFSACDDHETSLDFHDGYTNSFIQSVKDDSEMTYGALLKAIRANVRETEKRLYGPNAVPPKPQVPQLTSSGKFDIQRKPFTL